MIKITFFTGTLLAGGAERVICILANKFVQIGYSVEILQFYKSECAYLLNSGVKIKVVEEITRSKNRFQNLFWIRRYIKKNTDVVISFMAPFNMLMLMATIGIKIPIIVADRNDPRRVPANKCIRVLRNLLYVLADGVVLQTSNNFNYFNKWIKKKSRIIYNPIDLGNLTGEALCTEKQKEIVSIGRLVKQKNQKKLIEAFALVHKKHPDYRLVIYGEGDMRQELELQCKRLDISDVVSFPGSVNDVHKRILSADFFVLSSDYEGMPNALIEAMCLGLPVISTKVSGAVDLINKKNGILVDVDSIEQIELAMSQLIENKELRISMGQNAVQLADALSVEKIAGKWIDFIDKILVL